MDNSRMKAVCNWTLCSAAVNTMVLDSQAPNETKLFQAAWLQVIIEECWRPGLKQTGVYLQEGQSS